MAQVTVRGVHISAPLSELSLGYHPVGFVAESVAPVVGVTHENDVYYIWDRADALREIVTLRADGAEAAVADFGFTKAPYVCEEYAVKTKITDRQRDNADKMLQLEVSKIRRVQDLILAGQERRVANLFSTTSLASSNQTTLSGANQWNNSGFAGSIEQNIDTGNETVRQSLGGLPPNTLIVPKAVAKVVKRDSKVRDLIKYTHAELLVDGELPPRLWGLVVVMPSVATAVSSTGNPIVEDKSAGTSAGSTLTIGTNLFDIWGKNVFLLHKAENPGLDIISAAYVFRARPWQVKTWREEEIDTTFYQPSFIQTEKLVSNIAAYGIFSAIA